MVVKWMITGRSRACFSEQLLTLLFPGIRLNPYNHLSAIKLDYNHFLIVTQKTST